jgi:hypothetical protein
MFFVPSTPGAVLLFDFQWLRALPETYDDQTIVGDAVLGQPATRVSRSERTKNN